MTCAEQQLDELEALKSIYDGDDCFNAVSDKTFQYKMGEDQTAKSMVLEIKWGENYPDELPDINLDAFYNKHLLIEVKDSILSKVAEEANQYIGMAMTFSLFEYAKENATDLLSGQPETTQNQDESKPTAVAQEKKVKEKKEQLSKAQKRKMADRVDLKGERPRGWDWVDVVKHLSQSGKQHQQELKQQQQQKSS